MNNKITTKRNNIVDEEFKMNIIHKTYHMMKELYLAVQQYPKSEKYAICQETKYIASMLLQFLVKAKKRTNKKTILQDADASLELLRLYVRLGNELKYLDNARYESISRLNIEIGKMIGGWLKEICAN